jgi:hypothetical protein
MRNDKGRAAHTGADAVTDHSYSYDAELPDSVEPMPKCDKCGAEITTGLMAVFCPLAEQCEFWVPEQAEFLHELRDEHARDSATPSPMTGEKNG